MARWRDVGTPGMFEDWIVGLRGYSGVYAIRERSSGVVLYVGESHTGRLYETMTRHFQSSSKLYKGPTFNRHLCEAKVEICTPAEALDLQDDWIASLHPELNDIVPVRSTDDEVPF